MQLIKEKILFKSRQTQNIKFFLTADNSFGGCCNYHSPEFAAVPVSRR